MKYTLGIDLGGTNIAAGIVDEQYTILVKGSRPTLAKRPPEEITADIATHCADLCAKLGISMSDISGVGMAIPGTVNSDTGIVEYANNIRFRDFPIRELFSRFSGISEDKIAIGNDANIAALGEAVGGAAKGTSSSVMITLGTGVGGGIIANGQLVRGVHFTAGEYSFVNTNAEAWDAPDQNMACQCSTRNLLLWYRARKGLPEDAPMNGRVFFDAANAGEPEALEVLERFCRMVAVQIYNLTVLLDVEKVAIGGGISKQPLLLDSLRRVYAGLFASRGESPYMIGLPRCEIVPCHFSSEANQVGALYTYLQAESETI